MIWKSWYLSLGTVLILTLMSRSQALFLIGSTPNKRLYLGEEGMTFMEASWECRNNTMTLTQLDEEAEHSLIAQVTLLQPSFGPVWIGGRSSTGLDIFIWSDDPTRPLPPQPPVGAWLPLTINTRLMLKHFLPSRWDGQLTDRKSSHPFHPWQRFQDRAANSG